MNGFPMLMENPTQDQVRNWLRETHKIYVHNTTGRLPGGIVLWGTEIYDLNLGYKPDAGYILVKQSWKLEDLHKTYEGAIEEGIYDALLIVDLRKINENDSEEVQN